MSSFENYFRAAEMMCGKGLDEAEIGKVTALIVSSFRQGTGLGPDLANMIIDAVFSQKNNKVKLARVTKGRNFPSGSHWPKYVIVPDTFGDTVVLEFGVDGWFTAISGNDKFVTPYNGDTPEMAWKNYFLISGMEK